MVLRQVKFRLVRGPTAVRLQAVKQLGLWDPPGRVRTEGICAGPAAGSSETCCEYSRMRSILDPLFRYTSSHQTDIRKTYARVRKEQRRAEHSRTTPDSSASEPIALPAQRVRATRS